MVDQCKTRITGQICPACGCTVVGEGVDKGGVIYCCEPCSEGNTGACECGCCKPVEGQNSPKSG